MPDQAAYHVQQAAEKLTKAALVANEIRPRKGHVIKASATRLPAQFVDRARSSNSTDSPTTCGPTDIPRRTSAGPAPLPSAAEARAWLDEVEALKADFERWLAEREAAS